MKKKLERLNDYLNANEEIEYEHTIRKGFSNIKFPQDKKEEYRKRLSDEFELIECVNNRLHLQILVLLEMAKFLRNNRIFFIPPSELSDSLILYCLHFSYVDPITLNLPFRGFIEINSLMFPKFGFFIERGGKQKLITHLKKVFGKEYIKDVVPQSAVVPGDSFSNHIPYTVVSSIDIEQFFPTTIGREGKKVVVCEREQIRDCEILYFMCIETDNYKDIATGFEDMNILYPEKIPLDDEKTFELISSGHGEGLGQFAKPYLRGLLSIFKPRNFAEFIAFYLTTLYSQRKKGTCYEYLKRAKGKEEFTEIKKRLKTLFPYEKHISSSMVDSLSKIKSLESILNETYGLILYDDQAFLILTEYAGFTPFDAHQILLNFRVPIPGKDEEIKRDFFKNAVEKGHDAKEAKEVWKAINIFAPYLKKASLIHSLLPDYWRYFLKSRKMEEEIKL
jgi:DNA polymerase III alpha subunit